MAHDTTGGGAFETAASSDKNGDTKTAMAPPPCKLVILFGPPGAGKGAQAEILTSRFQCVHLSTGDILREEIRNGTELGLKVKVAVEAGEFTDDETVTRIVADHLDTPDPERSFVLDGFPRTLSQAELLDKILTNRGKKIDRVLFITAPKKVVLQRLTGRRVCTDCGATYHVDTRPPRVAGTCDRCGSTVKQRPDDSPKTCQERLRTYESKTRPLTEYYKQMGTLVTIDGNQTFEAVSDDIATALWSGSF